MIKKINFYHSLIFFNLSIVLSAFAFLRDSNLTILCLFLILTIVFWFSHIYLYSLSRANFLKQTKYENVMYIKVYIIHFKSTKNDY